MTTIALGKGSGFVLSVRDAFTRTNSIFGGLLEGLNILATGWSTQDLSDSHESGLAYFEPL